MQLYFITGHYSVSAFFKKVTSQDVTSHIAEAPVLPKERERN